jgi:hypothetical protein
MRLHVGGAEGLLEEMRDTLLQMKDSIDPDRMSLDLGNYFDRLEKLYNKLYPQGRKVEIEHKGKVEHEHEHTITINRIIEEFQIVDGDILEDDEDDKEEG